MRVKKELVVLIVSLVALFGVVLYFISFFPNSSTDIFSSVPVLKNINPFIKKQFKIFSIQNNNPNFNLKLNYQPNGEYLSQVAPNLFKPNQTRILVNLTTEPQTHIISDQQQDSGETVDWISFSSNIAEEENIIINIFVDELNYQKLGFTESNLEKKVEFFMYLSFLELRDFKDGRTNNLTFENLSEYNDRQYKEADGLFNYMNVLNHKNLFNIRAL